MTRPAITSGTFVDISDPETLEWFGLGLELLVQQRRRNGWGLPDTVAGEAVRAVIAMRRAQWTTDKTSRACAPAQVDTGPDLHRLRTHGQPVASGAKYLTVNEAACELDRSPQRVRQLIDEGRLIAKKVGRNWHLDPQSVANRKKG